MSTGHVVSQPDATSSSAAATAANGTLIQRCAVMMLS
jgi:hypothetical protein